MMDCAMDDTKDAGNMIDDVMGVKMVSHVIIIIYPIRFICIAVELRGPGY